MFLIILIILCHTCLWEPKGYPYTPPGPPKEKQHPGPGGVYGYALASQVLIKRGCVSFLEGFAFLGEGPGRSQVRANYEICHASGLEMPLGIIPQ